jgi:hypothetical protein
MLGAPKGGGARGEQHRRHQQPKVDRLLGPKATAKVAPAPLRENTQWGPSGGSQPAEPRGKGPKATPGRGKGGAAPPALPAGESKTRVQE